MVEENNSKIKMKSLNIKTNLFFNWIIQILTYLTPLITAPYLSRVLTPTGVGNYSYVNSIIQYLVLLVSFGFVDYGTHRIAQNRNDKKEYSSYSWSIFWCRLFLFVTSTIVFYIPLFFYDYGSNVKLLFYILGINVLTCVFTMNYFYKGMENYRLLSLAHLLTKLINLVLIFFIIKTPNDIYKYALINVTTNLTVTLLLWIYAIKYIGKPSFEINKIIICFKEGFFYFLPTVATSVFTLVDITILGAMISKEEVAYYEQANKIQTMVSSLIISICPIMIARMAILRKHNDVVEIKRKFTQLANLIGILSFPCFFGLIAINKFFTPLFFGDDYISSISVLYWLAPQIICVPISYSIACAYYIPENKINYITVFEFIVAIINIITNILILRFTDLGAVGVAITSFFAAVLMDILTISFSWKKVNYLEMAKKMIKPLIASSIMFVTIILINRYAKIDNNLIQVILDVIVGIFVYSLLVLVLRDKLVIDFLNSFLNKFKRKNK